MRFERVQIEGFGPIQGFEASFEPQRLNLIIGPNESGKSSLAQALTVTLFGFSSHEEEQRAKPWEGNRHRATVVFEAVGERYRMRRDFVTHEVHVERLGEKGEHVEAIVFQGTANPRGRGPELEQYETLLRSWFGFTEPRLFRESCFVHENALETRISPELRHLISGAVEADYQEIQNALMDRLDALTREHPYDPKLRKRTDRSIERRLAGLELLRGRLTRSEYVLRELKSNSSERSASETRMAGLKADLAAKEQLLVDLETMLRLREEQRKLLKRAPEIGIELTRARKARYRLQEIDRKVQENLGYLAKAPDEVETDLMRLEILRTQRSRHTKTSEAERKRLDEIHPPPFPLVLVMGLAIGAAMGFLGYAASKSSIAAGIGGVLGAGVGMIVMRLFGRSAERGRSLSEAKVRVAEENMKTLKQELDVIAARARERAAGARGGGAVAPDPRAPGSRGGGDRRGGERPPRQGSFPDQPDAVPRALQGGPGGGRRSFRPPEARGHGHQDQDRGRAGFAGSPDAALRRGRRGCRERGRAARADRRGGRGASAGTAPARRPAPGARGPARVRAGLPEGARGPSGQDGRPVALEPDQGQVQQGHAGLGAESHGRHGRPPGGPCGVPEPRSQGRLLLLPPGGSGQGTRVAGATSADPGRSHRPLRRGAAGDAAGLSGAPGHGHPRSGKPTSWPSEPKATQAIPPGRSTSAASSDS